MFLRTFLVLLNPGFHKYWGFDEPSNYFDDHRSWERKEVTLNLEDIKDYTKEEILDIIFTCGQNGIELPKEFHWMTPRTRSICSGDVIYVGDYGFVVEPVGFTYLPQWEVNRSLQ